MVLDEEPIPGDREHVAPLASDLERELEAQDQRVTAPVLRQPLLPRLVA